ncbi:unnamed protein product [Durusdinium trenchii]
MFQLWCSSSSRPQLPPSRSRVGSGVGCEGHVAMRIFLRQMDGIDTGGCGTSWRSGLRGVGSLGDVDDRSCHVAHAPGEKDHASPVGYLSEKQLEWHLCMTCAT